MFIFERERERERETETETEQGRAEREGDRECQAGSALSAWSPTQGSDSRNHEITTPAKTKSDAQPTEPPRHPSLIILG